jgi:hypothetical protein
MTGWDLMDCDKALPVVRRPTFPRFVVKSSPPVYAPDWANTVPNLIAKLVSEIADKKKLELRFNLLEILANDLQTRIHKLENAQSKIVAINTFAPELYDLLKPILVSVQTVEDEFEAGWFDANIHTSGGNEEEAVSNLKSLILDYFEIFTNEPSEKLGIEPKRQLAILNQYIQKRP